MQRAMGTRKAFPGRYPALVGVDSEQCGVLEDSRCAGCEEVWNGSGNVLHGQCDVSAEPRDGHSSIPQSHLDCARNLASRNVESRFEFFIGAKQQIASAGLVG